MRQLEDIAAAAEGALEVFDARWSADSVTASITLDCSDVVRAVKGGLRVRARERFNISIGRGFPYAPPIVTVEHSRFAGTPHVQWGRLLCLYAAPDVEWQIADGMYGLIDRLRVWIERAAANELDPIGLPLHPPVAYADVTAGVMVVRSDVPDLADGVVAGAGTPPVATLHLGVCEKVRDDRYDLVGWADLGAWRAAAGTDPVTPGTVPPAGALVVLLDRDIGFEYPETVRALLNALGGIGVDIDVLLQYLNSVAHANMVRAVRHSVDTAPLHVFIGTPSRRPDGHTVRFHLVCWRLDDLGEAIAVVAGVGPAGTADWSEVSATLEAAIPNWRSTASTSWVRVLEARSEVTVRRDDLSASAWLREKRVLVLGCGALRRADRRGLRSRQRVTRRRS